MSPEAAPAACASELPSLHGAAVGLVIHASQVQQAVQHQDAQFVLDAVAQFGGLRRGAVERNRDIRRAGNDSTSVAIVLAAKLPIQCAQFRDPT